MNSKERAVLIFLCVTFLIGVGLSFNRNYQDKRYLGKLVIRKQTNDTITQNISDTIFDDEDYDTNQSIFININTASNKELEALSGIGPVIANRIIEYRQKNGRFKTKEEILKVSGIGAKKFDGIKDKIVTE